MSVIVIDIDHSAAVWSELLKYVKQEDVEPLVRSLVEPLAGKTPATLLVAVSAILTAALKQTGQAPQQQVVYLNAMHARTVTLILEEQIAELEKEGHTIQ